MESEPSPTKPMSHKEKRIRSVMNLYYSKPEIQKAIYEFSKNREISPRYFEGFGKRPDSFQYPSDVYGMVQKGATSFHCSEELWKDPLEIITGMTEEQANELRIGWDLLIDIDCKWIDFSKKAALAVINVLHKHNVKNIGIKYSGSKGFHILIPWKSFPKQVSGFETKDLFPDLPRKILAYIRFKAESEMKQLVGDDIYKTFKKEDIKKGVKCNICKEIASEYKRVEYYCPNCKRQEVKKLTPNAKQEYKCPECRRDFIIQNSRKEYECFKCRINSEKNPNNFSRHIEIDLFELMGLDIVLVSPRHLFRMPYSLHEKTAFSSIVLNLEELKKFDPKDADPLNVKIKNFLPDSKEGESKELVISALDWYGSLPKEKEKKATGKFENFKPIELKNITENDFPPCINKILNGLEDGKKRGLFILINLFRSIGMDKEALEKTITEWNEKNKPPIKKGYIKAQLDWAYKRKPLLPPNCREYYQGFGVCQPDQLCNQVKNPVNYTIKQNYKNNPQKKKKK